MDSNIPSLLKRARMISAGLIPSVLVQTEGGGRDLQLFFLTAPQMFCFPSKDMSRIERLPIVAAVQQRQQSREDD